PLAGDVSTVKFVTGPSTSEPVKVIGSGVSSAFVIFWPNATGASFTFVIVIVTVATADVSEPSFTLKVKLTVPKKFVAGVYVRLGAVPLNVPLAGWVSTVKFVTGPSTSAPVSVIDSG